MTEIIHLPPYVAPEHQQLLDDAQKLLETYSESLAESLKPQVTKYTTPSMADYEAAQRAFLTDPFRLKLVANLVRIKSLVERPQMMIREQPLDK